MRLVTLGLRNIAASILWSKANHYKMTENWTAFEATLNQLSKLQPYFISFWRYQAWNLTYNVSVELDDVENRYFYVKRGIGFLKDGVVFNEESPYLLSDLGWFIGNKVGRADEHILYRRLFKNDDDFHPPDRPISGNGIIGLSRKFGMNGQLRAVDVLGKSLGQKNPTTFFAAPAMSQMNHTAKRLKKRASSATERGKLGRSPARLWQKYGNRELRASNGLLIRLADQQRWESAAQGVDG